MSKVPGRLTTYCTNIHPADSWDETFAALRSHIPAVKAAVSPRAPFPIGLRLSSRAAAELTPEQDRCFRKWLAEENCFVPTINGFPFGSFHNDSIKELVYHPDWNSPERAEYSIRLADLLAGWLPEGFQGSISTVPLGFKQALQGNPGDRGDMMKQLELVLTHLARLFERSGKKIILALEPEPGCLLETTEEVCRFFERLRFGSRLRRHLAICYDCCHQAVQFEDPARSLHDLAAAGVPLAKVQVSSALKLKYPDSTARFDESRYLHQVVVRHRDGGLSRYRDLPDAISSHEASAGDEWRCHFHVPIFSAGYGAVQTTRDFVTDVLPLVPEDVLLEVETYTWEVLPEELRTGSVTDSIIREISWLKEQLHA